MKLSSLDFDLMDIALQVLAATANQARANLQAERTGPSITPDDAAGVTAASGDARSPDADVDGASPG